MSSIVSESADRFCEAISYSLSRLGFSGVSLKEEQLKAVKAVYEGLGVFVCLPNGYGNRSLSYQILPFLMGHKLGENRVILVDSPLVALFVDRLKKRGVRASILSSATLVTKKT